MMPMPILIILGLGSFFYLFIYTAYTALHIADAPIFGIVFGAFLYLQLWMLVSACAFEAAAELYGLNIRWLRRLLYLFENTDRRPDRFRGIFFGFISYAIAVYGFALAYVAISRAMPNSFSVNRLDLLDGLYFSTITIATVGFGDIVPRTTLPKVATILEVQLGLMYVVFFFSIVASVAKAGPSKRESNSNGHGDGVSDAE